MAEVGIDIAREFPKPWKLTRSSKLPMSS